MRRVTKAAVVALAACCGVVAVGAPSVSAALYYNNNMPGISYWDDEWTGYGWGGRQNAVNYNNGGRWHQAFRYQNGTATASYSPLVASPQVYNNPHSNLNSHAQCHNDNSVQVGTTCHFN
jgi:hypothetical protein